MQLRVYQKKILNQLYTSLKTNNKALLSLPTGCGKSFIMYSWAKHFAAQNKTTVIVVDRQELIDQMVDMDSSISVLKANSKHEFMPTALIHVVMLQTGCKRIQQLLDLSVDYLMFDEIHNYYDGIMFNALIECWSKAQVIGVSATPIDSKGYLLEGFDDLIMPYQTQDMIDMGYLVKPNYYTPPNYNLDLSMVRITNGDYNVDDLDGVLINENSATIMYQQWYELAKDRQTIVFCSSIKQAHFLRNYFCSKGVHAASIDSLTVNRSSVIDDYKEKKINVLFNVACLVAGFDAPLTSCIIFANPTRVLRRYLQQCGRGLRLAINKKDCLMLDFANNTQQHGFCNDLRFYKHKRDENQFTHKDCPECGAIVSRATSVCPYCGYDFSAVEDATTRNKGNKKELERLQKALSLQQELKQKIEALVNSRGYKNGYKWYLFIDCLKTKRPTESSIQFFKRKITLIEKIRKNKWKLARLKYD